MAVGDVFKLHVVWGNTNNPQQTSENGFSFMQTAPLVFDTPGEDLVEAFTAEVIPLLQDVLHSNYVLQSFRVETLPGHLTVHEAAGGGQNGALTGDQLPPFVAGVVTIRSATPGRRGRGRLFLGPVSEGRNTSGGGVLGDHVTDMEEVVQACIDLEENILYAGWQYGVWSDEDQAFREVTSYVGRNVWGKQSGRST